MTRPSVPLPALPVLLASFTFAADKPKITLDEFAAKRYHDEGAIFQIDKVRSPTHIVAGADDIRVAVSEDYLLDHALFSLGIPSTLLIFPGEGHSLDKNPWQGKIKVREELKWLQKYGGVGPVD